MPTTGCHLPRPQPDSPTGLFATPRPHSKSQKSGTPVIRTCHNRTMRNRDRDEHSADHLEPLVRIGDPNEANLLIAQLRGEGIQVHTRGESSGPYPVNVGGLAEVEIWVDANRIPEAQAIVAEFRP